MSSDGSTVVPSADDLLARFSERKGKEEPIKEEQQKPVAKKDNPAAKFPPNKLHNGINTILLGMDGNKEPIYGAPIHVVVPVMRVQPDGMVQAGVGGQVSPEPCIYVSTLDECPCCETKPLESKETFKLTFGFTNGSCCCASCGCIFMLTQNQANYFNALSQTQASIVRANRVPLPKKGRGK